jgi:hypothetical protein
MKTGDRFVPTISAGGLVELIVKPAISWKDLVMGSVAVGDPMIAIATSLNVPV